MLGWWVGIWGVHAFGSWGHVLDFPICELILVAEYLELRHLRMRDSWFGLSCCSTLLRTFVKVILRDGGRRSLKCFGFGIGSLQA